ncbi:N,N-dimethylformamidase beta subunit family domain-containing protein [Paraburkholderia madseniana]|uniref:N,N-dimethylformamidase beta subunit family domain-containing protein n=1 Tax=Paraburkholderia TaxID=1822464 RepID=UPI001F42851A|nr:N,N-dimethylformamidase beta subunit family domain-containing protein [Paraburkholderia madseniana]
MIDHLTMTTSDSQTPAIIGYATPWSAHAGQELAFKISSRGARAFTATVERIDCCDPNPDGPGMKLVPIDVRLQSTYPGQEQPVFPGSCAYGPMPALENIQHIKLYLTVQPTLEDASLQTLVALQNHDGTHGVTIALTRGELVFQSLANGELITTGVPVAADLWTNLQISIDRDGHIRAISSGTNAREEAFRNVADFEVPFSAASFDATSVCFAAVWTGHPEHAFNGFIESPELRAPSNDARGDQREDILLAHWDFTPTLAHTSVPNCLDSGAPLTLVNAPMRAVRSSGWTGRELDWKHAPNEYAAIRFHADDLSDCGWQTSVHLKIPADMASGVYGLRVDNGEGVDTIPFYVTVAPEGKHARIAFLAPTLTYLAYANNARGNFSGALADRVDKWGGYPHNPDVVTAFGTSTYNSHSDGSGISLSSRLRPILTMRPGYLTFLDEHGSGLRHFSADSHLTNWLREKGFEFDVVTDEDLDERGVDALKHYDVVLTGSHPEYHTRRMLDALLAYRSAGGSLMYLGGNGFYWKIGRAASAPHLLEIRRAEAGMRVWESQPGEYYNQLDGEYGGMWRRNGLPPQKVAGVGFTAEGDFRGTFYRRTPASFATEHSWLFAGVKAGAGEPLGNFGLSGGGAAGFEIDQTAADLGTPAYVTVVAYSDNHDASFVTVPEELLFNRMVGKPRVHSGIRAHMICGFSPSGGGLFAVGSISFLGSLYCAGYDNDVSQIVENCLRRFLAVSHSSRKLPLKQV